MPPTTPVNKRAGVDINVPQFKPKVPSPKVSPPKTLPEHHLPIPAPTSIPAPAPKILAPRTHRPPAPAVPFIPNNRVTTHFKDTSSLATCQPPPPLQVQLRPPHDEAISVASDDLSNIFIKSAPPSSALTIPPTPIHTKRYKIPGDVSSSDDDNDDDTTTNNSIYDDNLTFDSNIQIIPTNIITSPFSVWHATKPQHELLPMSITLKPFLQNDGPTIPQPPANAALHLPPRYVRCRECKGFLNMYAHFERHSWLCGFCSVFHDLPYGFFPRPEVERLHPEKIYDHFYGERKDMTTPVVTFPMASNYRIVPTLPIPIYVVAEAGYTLPKNTVGCVFVVSSKSVTAVCSDNSCFTLSDFEDLIIPAPLASFRHKDVGAVQNVVDGVLKNSPPAAQDVDFERALTIAANIASYLGGGELNLVSNTFSPTLDFATKFSKFTIQCNTCTAVVDTAGVERNNLTIQKMGNGGSVDEGYYDVTIRIRCSRALRVTGISGPGVIKSEIPPFLPRDGSSLLHNGDPSRVALEMLEDDMISAFTVPKCSLDATFKVNLEFDFRDADATNSYRKVELSGRAMMQMSCVFTDKDNNRFLTVGSRAWDATMDTGAVAKGLSVLGWVDTVSNSAINLLNGDASVGKVEEGRKLVRNYAGRFFNKFQSNANSAHLLKFIPVLCLGLEKSPGFRSDLEESVRSRYLQALGRGKGWLGKIAAPAFLNLNAEEEGEGGGWWWGLGIGEDEEDADWWPESVLKRSLPLSKVRMERLDCCYCLCDGLTLTILRRKEAGEQALRDAVDSPVVTQLLAFCEVGVKIRVEEEDDNNPGARQFFERLIEDRGSWVGGSFTLMDYTRYLDGSGIAAASKEFGGRGVIGMGRGRVARPAYNYNGINSPAKGVGSPPKSFNFAPPPPIVGGHNNFAPPPPPPPPTSFSY
ncbi:hypothetical protein TrLO_g15000 [Triparma laevis f. longispina]|nr:hypothetical protein TrLO_g15000 [Triparma laevis f. longispina]